MIQDLITPQTIPKNKNILLYKPHWYRYITFLIYIINQTYYGCFLSSYTPLQKPLTKHYKISESYIVATSSIFLTGNLLFAIFVYPLSKKIGLTWTIILSNLIGFIGSFLRIFMDDSFFFVLIGQFLLGIGSCFIINTVIQFCYNWFSPKNRPLFLAISSFMNTVGGGAGNILPILFVDENSGEKIFKKEIYFYNIFIMFLTLAIFLINLFFFRGKPPKGYGYINIDKEIKEKKKPKNFFKHSFYLIKDLLSHKLFITYFSIYLLCNSSTTFLGSMFDLIIIDFGFSPTIGAITMVIVIFMGLFSSIIYSIYFMKYKNQKKFQYFY